MQLDSRVRVVVALEFNKYTGADDRFCNRKTIKVFFNLFLFDGQQQRAEAE